MADNTIIVRSEAVLCLVSGRRMTNFPNTGTYISFEKLSPRATHVEGQHGTSTSVRNNGKSYRVTLTIVQNSPDDAFLSAAIRALAASNGVLAISITYGATVITSASLDIETEPTRELAADGSPTVAYTLTGTFPVVLISGFANPTVISEDEIAALIPA